MDGSKHGGADPTLSAPLSFSQLAGWNSLGLDAELSVRQVAWAARIHGALDHDLLESAVRQVVMRHAALRTQFATQDNQTRQIVTAPRFPAVRRVIVEEAEVIQRIEAIVAEPISVAADALFQVTLLEIALQDHALLVCLDHLIADAFSLNIVVGEILAAYTNEISLPPVLLQFPDYVRRQSGVCPHWEYWKPKLASWKAP